MQAEADYWASARDAIESEVAMAAAMEDVTAGITRLMQEEQAAAKKVADDAAAAAAEAERTVAEAAAAQQAAMEDVETAMKRLESCQKEAAEKAVADRVTALLPAAPDPHTVGTLHVQLSHTVCIDFRQMLVKFTGGR